MTVRAYRVQTETKIAPFAESPRSLEIADRTLEAWQDRAVASAGLELVDVARLEDVGTDRPCFVFFDDVFVSEVALRNFYADCMGEPQDQSLALPDGGLWRALGVPSTARSVEGGHAYDVFHLTSPERPVDRESLRAKAHPRLLASRTTELPIRLPRVEGARDDASATITLRIAAHVSHWIHLLRLSHFAIGLRLFEAARRHPWRVFWNRKVLRLKGPHLARKLVFVHETAEVHPTADLEGAVIGPGCRVRAHAHVHFSVLGQDVDVGDHARVMGCTLAPRVQVLRASYLALCAAMADGTLANYKVQLSLFGREVFLTSSAWLLDAKLQGGRVRIEHEGQLLELDSPFLGACLGHRVTLGAQVTLAPGRAVPNGAIIVGPLDHVALKVPAELPSGILAIKDGKIVPV